MSKVLYIEIFDENQKTIVQEKYLLNNNKASGSFTIPEDVQSKHYYLRAYTRYMRNFSIAYFHYQQLTIVNPYIEGGTTEISKADAIDKSYPTLASPQSDIAFGKQLQIEPEKEKYQFREPIRIHIKSPEPISAELSAVVRLKGLGNQPSSPVVNKNEWLLAACLEDPYCRKAYADEGRVVQSLDKGGAKEADTLSAGQLHWRPETRGLTISGVVQNEKKENVVGALSMVSVLQKEPLLYLGTTDEQGAFTICLHHLQDQKELFVGTPNEKNNVLIRKDFDTNFPDITNIPLKYDSTVHRLLEALHLHQQLVRVYPPSEKQVVYQPNSINGVATNILSPDRRIALDDFIQMATMSEVFTEITPGVLLRKKEGKERLSVFNAEQQKWYDSPLILLDNVPVFNISELLKIDPAKIEAIEMYNSNYFLGDYTLDAIISITSKTDNFATYQWGEQVAFTVFNGFAVSQPFEQVVQEGESHFPDFRPVLFWQPDLKLTPQKGSETIAVFAPDRPGVYEVVVQGFTASGEACFGHRTIEVYTQNP